MNKEAVIDKTKQKPCEPTNLDLYECLLSLSIRIFKQQKITKKVLVISILNLILTILSLLR